VGTDNCPASATTTQTAGLASGATFPLGTTTNTFSVTSNGQTATCSFTVTVVDTVRPAIACPAPITQYLASGNCTAMVSYTATATDNCAVSGIAYSPAPESALNHGMTTVTATATDASGRTATCSFTVTVVDSISPIITCPAPITQYLASGNCTAMVT
jgi:HYR domain